MPDPTMTDYERESERFADFESDTDELAVNDDDTPVRDPAEVAEEIARANHCLPRLH